MIILLFIFLIPVIFHIIELFMETTKLHDSMWYSNKTDDILRKTKRQTPPPPPTKKTKVNEYD